MARAAAPKAVRSRAPREPVPEEPVAPGEPIRIVVTGKGGVGKTTISAALARVLARGERRVLAVDADAQLNLAAALGMPRSRAESLVPLSANAAYIAEKTGAAPGDGYGLLFRLNPDVDDVVDRFGQHAPDGVRFLAMGTLSGAGAGCLCPENTVLAETIRALALHPDEAIVLDTQAGVEHFGRAIARGFSHAVIVTDPTYSGIGVAVAAARLAGELGIPSVHLVVNRVRGRTDRSRIEAELATRPPIEFATKTWIPDDELVLAAEPSVDRLLEIPDEPFIAAIRGLTQGLQMRLPAAATR